MFIIYYTIAPSHNGFSLNIGCFNTYLSTCLVITYSDQKKFLERFDLAHNSRLESTSARKSCGILKLSHPWSRAEKNEGMHACQCSSLYSHSSASHAQGMVPLTVDWVLLYQHPTPPTDTDLPIDQTDIDNPSLRLSFQMILDCASFRLKINHCTCFSSHQELGISVLNEDENSLYIRSYCVC